jgi:hypothetical protein
MGGGMSDDDFFNELANAIHKLRTAFLKRGLEPPLSIELGSIEAGRRFQLSIPKDMIAASFGFSQRDKPDPDVIIPFMGVEIRYPAELRNRPGGRVDFDDGVAGRSFYSLDGKRIR